jgi:F-type H+-transporting ATPase subunit epsilon
MADTGPRQLQCVVVTPERAVLDEPADSVVLPLFDGELGVLVNHAPLVGRLGYGELRVRRGESVRRYFVDGGFAQVRANVVTVLTARAVKTEEVDAAAAQQALEEALRPGPTEQTEARHRAQERARGMLRVAGHTSAAAGPEGHG